MRCIQFKVTPSIIPNKCTIYRFESNIVQVWLICRRTMCSQSAKLVAVCEQYERILEYLRIKSTSKPLPNLICWRPWEPLKILNMKSLYENLNLPGLNNDRGTKLCLNDFKIYHFFNPESCKSGSHINFRIDSNDIT